MLCRRCYLLVRKLRNARAMGSVLDGDRADVAFGVHVEQGVLVEVASVGDGRIAEFNVRSKKALTRYG